MPRFLISLSILLISSFGVFISSFELASAQVYHKVQGTNVWVSPPTDYQTSYSFTGFTNEKTGGSILVMNVPYENAVKTNEEFQNPEAFIKLMKEQGFDISGYKQDVTRDNISFRVYYGTQKTDGTLYYRWVSMFISDKSSYIITIQTPDKNEFTDADILKTYQQLRFFGEQDLEEAINALPYTITPAAPFKVDAILMGNTVQLIVPNNENSPHVMVTQDSGYALAPSDVSSAQKYYLASIASTFKVKPDAKSQTVEFAGVNGLLLEGIAQTNMGDTSFMLYTSVDKDGTIFHLHATGKAEELQKYKTQINKIAKSIMARKVEADKK